MTIKRFVEAAIEGGWSPKPFLQGVIYGADTKGDELRNMLAACYAEQIMLDPESWKAVGKVEGWTNENGGDYRWKMTALPSALCDGKTIEEYLETL